MKRDSIVGQLEALRAKLIDQVRAIDITLEIAKSEAEAPSERPSSVPFNKYTPIDAKVVPMSVRLHRLLSQFLQDAYAQHGLGSPEQPYTLAQVGKVPIKHWKKLYGFGSTTYAELRRLLESVGVSDDSNS